MELDQLLDKVRLSGTSISRKFFAVKCPNIANPAKIIPGNVRAGKVNPIFFHTQSNPTITTRSHYNSLVLDP